MLLPYVWATRIRCWAFTGWKGQNLRWRAHWRILHPRFPTVDEYGVFFVNLFEMHGMAPSQVTHIIISFRGCRRSIPRYGQVCEHHFSCATMFVEPGIRRAYSFAGEPRGSWSGPDGQHKEL